MALCQCFLRPAQRGRGLRLTCPSRLCAACLPYSTLSEGSEPPSVRPPKKVPFHRQWLLKRGGGGSHLATQEAEKRRFCLSPTLGSGVGVAGRGWGSGRTCPSYLADLHRPSVGGTVLRKGSTQALCSLCLQIHAVPCLEAEGQDTMVASMLPGCPGSPPTPPTPPHFHTEPHLSKPLQCACSVPGAMQWK